MKPVKYILLISFALLLIGILGKSALLFSEAELFLFIGLLINILASIVYGILSLINKQHRIEAGMMALSSPLVIGLLFSLMRWPGGGVFIVFGSGILLMGSIVIFIYTIAQNRKNTLGVLYLAIGFGSLFFCFKFMRWPGAAILFLPTGISLIASFIFLLVKREKLNVSKTISLMIIGLIIAVFFSSSSQLYRIKYLNILQPETNFSENYYIYAWLLNREGKKEEAKLNLELAIKTAENPYNFDQNEMADGPKGTVERYERAMHLLNTNSWSEYERPINSRH